MREEIRRYLNAIKLECEKHMGKNSWCDGCSLRMADEGCFLGMNPKLPCNWDLGADLGVNLVDNLGKTKEVTTMALDGFANTMDDNQSKILSRSSDSETLLYALQLAVNNALYWRERALKAEKMLEEEGLK